MSLGGFGSGPSCWRSMRVFSVRQTSQRGIPALRGWHLLTICHLIVGSSGGLPFFNSQYLLESVVPALSSFLRSCLWLEYLSLKVFPVLP